MRYPVLQRAGAFLLSACLIPARLPAQSAEQLRASFQAHRSEFDYLLGDWQYTAQSREWGPYHGAWSAVRLSEGQILDEFRVLGDSGETLYVTTTLRAFNARLDRWELVGMDSGNGLQDGGTGRKVGDEIHIEQRFGVGGPQPSVWRIRYYDIRPDGFHWTADRSTDGGVTWEREHLRIEARRVGPPRTLGPIARARP
ncbi:MAG TPA: hypothetical protein VFH97_02095 [Gemmatimonadales bacterium]|nr:hypothetical protein [Gemmatimonadales bacterium]